MSKKQDYAIEQLFALILYSFFSSPLSLLLLYLRILSDTSIYYFNYFVNIYLNPLLCSLHTFVEKLISVAVGHLLAVHTRIEVKRQ